MSSEAVGVRRRRCVLVRAVETEQSIDARRCEEGFICELRVMRCKMFTAWYMIDFVMTLL